MRKDKSSLGLFRQQRCWKVRAENCFPCVLLWQKKCQSVFQLEEEEKWYQNTFLWYDSVSSLKSGCRLTADFVAIFQDFIFKMWYLLCVCLFYSYRKAEKCCNCSGFNFFKGQSKELFFYRLHAQYNKNTEYWHSGDAVFLLKIVVWCFGNKLISFILRQKYVCLQICFVKSDADLCDCLSVIVLYLFVTQ